MRHEDFSNEKPAVDYETLLFDCMADDATLFQRADAIEASWRVVQLVLDTLDSGSGHMTSYAAGTDGPAQAEELLRREGRSWLPLAGPDKGETGKDEAGQGG